MRVLCLFVRSLYLVRPPSTREECVGSPRGTVVLVTSPPASRVVVFYISSLTVVQMEPKHLGFHSAASSAVADTRPVAGLSSPSYRAAAPTS